MSDKLQFVDRYLMSATSDKLKFVEHCAPRNSDEPTTLLEIYDRVVRDHPKPDTLNYKHDGVWNSVSAAEMLQRARDIAAGLYSRGVRKGDRVAILSESCLEWCYRIKGAFFPAPSGFRYI